MDAQEVGQYWNANADAWTQLARAGFDVYRDHLNTPAFLEMLPDIQGLRGLDIGCGEGSNTRQLAQRGAEMTGIDISERFIHHARQAEEDQSAGIAYHVASGLELPFEEASFDFATAFMSLMDMPRAHAALAEACRVLRPGGFVQYSITHPCTNTPHRRQRRDEQGNTYALELGGYFHHAETIDEWIFSAAPAEVREGLPLFRVPRFPHTLSEWLNMTIRAGLALEEIREPSADDETVRTCHHMQDTQVMPYFLHIRARRPEA